MTERIALVTTSYPHFDGDASGHFVETEARLLADAGAAVTVIAPRAAGRGQHDSEHRGLIEVLRVDAGDAFGWPGALSKIRQRPRRLLSAAGFAVRARALLQTAGPFDRVIAHWLVPCGVPIAVGHRALEIVVHGSDARLVLGLPAPARRALARRLLAAGARLRVVSHELRDALAAGLSSELARDAEVRPSPIDLGGAPSRATARRQLAVGAEERVVIVAGRLVESKRIDVALERALERAPDRLVVLGDGPLRARLAKRYPAALFLGQVPRPVALSWIAGADLLISASRVEGAPTVVREARALGVPVLAARAGDLGRMAAQDPGLTVF